ncbi:hypothetical protein VTK56DRAFT_366 [Thermocarpiscus australiensis]
MHYLTLNRETKFEVLYNQLELSSGDGKLLGARMKKRLKESPLSQFVEETRNGSLETKRTLIRIAFYLLVSEDWGNTWFGDGCKTAQSRTLLWPRDSTVLLVSFVDLLYKIFENQKYYRRQISRANAQDQPRESNCAQSPSPRSPLPGSPSGPPATPPSIPPASREGQIFFDALVQTAIAAKKRKHDESVLGLAGQTPPVELEIPANARLTYYIYVKDKTDGSDLGSPATYRHTDCMIVGGAFSCIKSSFEAAGHVPIIEIQTPFGRRSVASEEDWENAVLTIYNVRRSGGVVEVDVFV